MDRAPKSTGPLTEVQIAILGTQHCRSIQDEALHQDGGWRLLGTQNAEEFPPDIRQRLEVCGMTLAADCTLAAGQLSD
jgi:hypothetical protein